MGKRRTTATVLAGMLRENTGTHFLDSGSAYGRHWQRNQTAEFDKQSPCELSFTIREYGDKQDLDIEFTLNVYHWLSERVEYSSAMQRLFDAYARKPENQATTPRSALEVTP